MEILLLLLALGATVAGAGLFSMGSSGGTGDSPEGLDSGPDTGAPEGGPETDDPDPDAPASGGDAPDLPDSAYALDWAGLNAEEQYLVELINRARLDPVAEQTISGDVLARASNSEPDEPLAVLGSLAEAARGHSQDMIDRDFFSHTNPDGQGPTARAAEEGYSGGVGENIAYYTTGRAVTDSQGRVDLLHENLWASDGHQNNLLGDSYNVIGTGYVEGNYDGWDGTTMVTEKFASDGNTYLTGVVIEDADNDDFYDIGEGQGDVRVTAWDEDGNSYATSTWEAGGYTLELPPGTYTVRFEGGDLDQPYETTVTVTDENIKLDVEDPGVASVTATATAPGGSAEAEALLGTLAANDFAADMPEPEEEPMEFLI
jgi:hypothetical protein